MSFLQGYRTYIAAAGLFCLAVYQVSIGELPLAAQNFMAALAVFGVRSAIARQAK